MTIRQSDQPPARADVVCAVLTPVGRGAIATVGVRGTGAVAAVATYFEPASGQGLASLPIGRVVLGRFRSLAGTQEELVVGLVGEGEVEIHCHGGTAAVQAVTDALTAAGCQSVNRCEWASTQCHDPISAAALVALADTRTERTAAILLDQYHGALRQALKQCLALLQSDPRRAAELLDELLSRSDLGRHLTRPWRAVIAGPPNVGKSSLLNALLGYQRAIVFDEPGTTRDVLTATTALDGWPVELADTAGLREGGNAIEAEGMARALAQVAEADLVIQVLDAAAGWQGRGDRRQGTGDRGQEADGSQYSVLSTQYPASHSLIVHNKCDLRLPPHDGRPAGLFVSAKTGRGIDEVVQTIAQRLIPSPPPRGAAVPFTEGQLAVLNAARERLERRDIDGARRTIESLL